MKIVALVLILILDGTILLFGSMSEFNSVPVNGNWPGSGYEYAGNVTAGAPLPTWPFNNNNQAGPGGHTDGRWVQAKQFGLSAGLMYVLPDGNVVNPDGTIVQPIGTAQPSGLDFIGALATFRVGSDMYAWSIFFDIANIILLVVLWLIVKGG